MCPSSSFRCGLCLSKWNGKSWEESYKCVLPLRSWSLVLNNKYQLCVEGLCDIDLNLTVCIPITDRLSSYWVSNKCTLVKLRGILNTKELPDYVAKKFAHGIPTNWKEIVNTWIQYVQQGEENSFRWEQNESFNSCNTSFLLTRRRRVIAGSTADGKSKEKSVQRIPTELSRVTEQERDSAVPTSVCSTKPQQCLSPPSIWHSASPQLPAYKVKEIFQWIDIAHLSSEPVERDTEDSCRDSDAEFVAPSDVVLNPKSRVPNIKTVYQKSSKNPQSTPLNSVNATALKKGLSSWNVSSVHSSSSMNHSVTLDSTTLEVFNKPNLQSCPRKDSPEPASKIPPSHGQSPCDNREESGSDTSSDQPLIDFVSESVFRKPSRGYPPKPASKSLSKKVAQHNSKNAEVPGSRMGKMLSSSLRPRRRQTLQKIERWRPVLGVDRCLKVQGYLLLQSDMTAGQILTTNTVVEWGARKVVTCDGREYELVGDPYGKIPDDLKHQLLSPLDCADITAKLVKFQALKDRSDWGAEYEVFYGNNNDDDCDSPNAGNSRMAHNMRNNRRTTPRNTSLARHRPKSGALTVNSQEVATDVLEPPISNKSRGNSRKSFGTVSTPPKILNSENPSQTTKSTRIITGLNQSVNNRSSNNVDRNNLNLTSSRSVREKESESVTVNNDLAVLSNNQQDKENNYIGKSSADATRSCFENITWKNTQNQMMLPSPRLSADSSNVDFSSSRIKVSYITPGSKSIQNNIQNSPEIHSRINAINESFSSNECSPKSRPSRSPSKRACLPCLLDSKPRTPSHSPHSPVLHTRRQTIPRRTTTQTVSPSPVRNRTETSSPNTRSKKMSLTKTSVEKTVTRRSLSRNSRTSVTNISPAKTPKSSTKHPFSPKSLRSSSKTAARQLRVVVKRLDTRRNLQNAQELSLQGKSTSSQPRRKSTPSQPRRKSTPSQPRRKSATKGNKQAPLTVSKKKERMKRVPTARKSPNKKPVEVKDKNEEKKNKGKKTTAKKTIHIDSETSDDADSDASECSSVSSVGPSASVIFQMNNSPVSRRKPRTLKERRDRDAQIAEMGRKLATKETIGLSVDDDPMANLIASQKFGPLPKEWCRHENLLGKKRKRRRPSSSDGTVSPSRLGLDDGFGNEDATSSVATPVLLMRPPDPKQVQSYLQRQRAWNTKPQRPTRQTKRGNDNLLLPNIDYAAAFRPGTSDSEECSSEISIEDSDWNE